ncbi:MAG TPA: metalloprotease PmbA [Burkholderiales bacterium]|nr:metalloprotease PmbA [Burkholderiales bacterium]
MASSRFTYSGDELRAMVEGTLRIARTHGATEAEADISEGYGQSVTVRRGEVETIEYNRDKGLSVTAYVGKQRGYASSSDLSPRAIEDTVRAALSIARFTAADDCAGLAEPELIVRGSRDLDLFHPWELPVEEAIVMARECEAAALRLDKRIVNSEGATVSCQQTQFIAGNTNGFLDGYPSSRHYISCAVIAGEGDTMQRDDWYSWTRAPGDLARPEAIGDYAGRRALARLRSRKLGTREARVLFEAPVANGLLSHFVSAVSGGSLYRKSSFLLDSLGTQVFAKIVNLHENPFLPRGLASGCFDDDGVATQERDVVKDGMLQGYFLGVYSARKLGMKSTGNAGGNANLLLAPGARDFEGMLRELGTGLLVTELMGQGINMVTGDYSRGAFGYWVEGGAIQYPVEEITIAGNLRDMFRNISAVGGDLLTRGSRTCGSILVEGMTIAGA